MPLPGHVYPKSPAPFIKDLAPLENILLATLPKYPPEPSNKDYAPPKHILLASLQLPSARRGWGGGFHRQGFLAPDDVGDIVILNFVALVVE
jgi:hypothetical protein